MKRFCSQFVFCSPEKILRQAVVEQNESGTITDLFLLSSRHSESAHTLFVDGILSAGIVSLKLQLPPEKLTSIQNSNQYIDLSSGILPDDTTPNEKLILDFGTNSIVEINQTLRFAFPFLMRLSVFDIISACVYRPALFLEQEAELVQGMKTNLLQWKGANPVISSSLKTHIHFTITPLSPSIEIGNIKKSL